uniref:Uncharacterized protein n=1 Tax=Rhizophora mucronata TaxID=61149 RepID=A0A2P2NK08_RHIMU
MCTLEKRGNIYILALTGSGEYSVTDVRVSLTTVRHLAFLTPLVEAKSAFPIG